MKRRDGDYVVEKIGAEREIAKTVAGGSRASRRFARPRLRKEAQVRDDAHDRQAFSELTLVVAVCEQALLALARLDREPDRALVESLERTRDLATAELRLGRFPSPRSGS